MLQRFLTVVLPILLPFLIYGIYLYMARRSARTAGAAELPRWQQAPWPWIVTASAVLLAISLITYRELSGVPAGTPLEPTRLELDERNRSLPVQ